MSCMRALRRRTAHLDNQLDDYPDMLLKHLPLMFRLHAALVSRSRQCAEFRGMPSAPPRFTRTSCACGAHLDRKPCSSLNMLAGLCRILRSRQPRVCSRASRTGGLRQLLAALWGALHVIHFSWHDAATSKPNPKARLPVGAPGRGGNCADVGSRPIGTSQRLWAADCTNLHYWFVLGCSYAAEMRRAARILDRAYRGSSAAVGVGR